MPRLQRRRVPDEEPCCEVHVTHIKFNHDPAPAALTNDAMNIRKDAVTAITAPEWTTGTTKKAEDSKAAYALKETTNQVINIKVRFTCLPVTLPSATVQATGGGVLGAIAPIVVTFKNGVSDDGAGGQYITIPLGNEQMHAQNIIQRTDIDWQWQYQCPNSTVWRDMEKTSHRIYVVLREPPAPWSQANAAVYPWTDALDHACDPADAGGTGNQTAAATNIVKHTFQNHGATYNTKDGASSYSGPGPNGTFAFVLTTYLQNLPNLGIVGCYDGTSAVTAFAAVVGCPMTFMFHEPWGYLNVVIAVGGARTNNPLFNSQQRLPWGNPFFTYGRVTGIDELGRSLFANHAYGLMAGDVYDATMKPPAAWWAATPQAAYLAAAIDESVVVLKQFPYQRPMPPPQPGVAAVFLVSEQFHQDADVAALPVLKRNNALSGVRVAPAAKVLTIL